jgi:hypothetical protein
MSEFQKIVIGLLGTTHPEIAWIKQRAVKQPVEKAQPQASRAKAVLGVLKFVFAALVIGSRTIPLGDNGHLVGELCAHAARLHTEA